MPPPPWKTADTELSIPEVFERQVRLQGGKTAIAGTSWEPSFAELDAAANGIAAALLARAPEPGRVALLMRHDAPLIAATLGALKAGKAALTLNPSDPPGRLEQIRTGVAPQAVLTDESNRGLAVEAGFSALVPVADRPEPGSAEVTAPAAPDDLAFLIYTSGSTGRPNGVMQPHRNVLHNVLRLSNGLGIDSSDRLVLLASLSSGQGLSTAMVGLLNGATLCPFPIMERGVTGLPGWLEENAVSVVVVSASVFRNFARTLNGRRLSGIRMLRLGSEAALRSDYDAYRRHFPPDCVFANTYSSSETGNVTQFLAGRELDAPGPAVPIGMPGEGVEVLILDEDGDETAPGEPGEIVVRGDHLSPGYWRDDDLTARRFRDGCFHTGDLGVAAEDGLLRWLGRKDAQVKVRGSRVDLSEVEAALGRLTGVHAAVAGPRPTPTGDTRLAAYVVPEAGSGTGPGELRAALRATLPDHAVPTGFAFLEAFPLNSHGKVDRQALAALELETPPTERQGTPASETEELVARIWREAFERPDIGRDDDFFALGGDSLTAAVVAAGLHAELGVLIELRALAESPTVAALAERVDGMQSSDGDDGRAELVRVDRGGPLPCSFIQERTWRHSRTPEESAGYTLASGVRIEGSLDIAALRRSIGRIVARHEALRTTFEERDGGPVQLIQPPGPVELPVVEVADDDEAAALLRREARAGFDLERAAVRFVLARLSEREHHLLRLNHHIVSDGESWTIFYDELESIYPAELRGVEPSLPPEEPLHYADFAAFERRSLGRGSHHWREEVDWWRGNLDGAPARTALPFSRPDPVGDAPVSDGVLWWGLDPGLSERLEALRRQSGVTYFMVRAAAFAALIGADDVVVGTYATTRRLAATQRIFGCFTNLVALRLRFHGNPSFRTWLAEVRGAVSDMSAHSQIPYGELCDDLGAAGAPPPELHAIISVRDVRPRRSFGGIEMSPLEHEFGSMPWRFSLQLAPAQEDRSCLAAFDARLHDPAAVGDFVEGYKRLLAEVAAEPDRPLRELLPGREGRLRRALRRARIP